jgi:hypothetical protein
MRCSIRAGGACIHNSEKMERTLSFLIVPRSLPILLQEGAPAIGYLLIRLPGVSFVP